MFTFGFSRDESKEENQEVTEPENKKEELIWFPAEKVEIPTELIDENSAPSFEAIETHITQQLSFYLVCPEDINCEHIIEAESQNSDLIPSKYEGGLKVWECTCDLAKYLTNENILFEDKKILDLGCGAGVIGLMALSGGATVHFQDYNSAVLRCFTIPNVLLNSGDTKVATDYCEFYSGDWQSFVDLVHHEYDLILTSETIYNPDNQKKLYEVFKQKLKTDGIGLVAAKTYYFGVGGGMRQFEELVKEDGVFDTKIVWKNYEGLQREILELRRKPIQTPDALKSPSP